MEDRLEEIIKKADEFDSQEEYDKSIELYNELLEKDCQNARIYALRGYSKFKAKNYKDAIIDFTSAIKLKKNVPTTFFYRAHAKENLGLLNEALKDYYECAKLDPQKADVHVNIGLIYEYQKEFLKAKQEYEAALKIDNKNDVALNSLKEMEIKLKGMDL